MMKRSVFMRNLNKKVRMMVLSLTFLVAILLEAVLPIVHVDGETREPSERLKVGESYIFDFEDGTDGEWNGRLGSETVSVTDEMAYSGDYSLKVTNRNRSHSGPSVNISDFVAPEGTYKIS